MNLEERGAYTGRADIVYIGDAPNPGDMGLVQGNIEKMLKVQKEYWDWKNKGE
jgi:hypothetical protein